MHMYLRLPALMGNLLLATLLLGTCLTAGDAAAGALYRCVDKNGVTAYSSGTAGYRQCKLVGSFPNAPKSAPAAAPAAPGGAKGQVEFRTATGGAQPKAAPAPAGAEAPRVARGAVYKYVKNGVSHYTNRRPNGRHVQVLFTYIESCFACNRSSAVDFQSVALNLTSFTDEVQAAALEHGVDAGLIRAIIHAESAFNPNAVSRVGAQGLMQLMPATAKRFGVSSAFQPADNIKGGVSYLAWLLKRFDGDERRVAAAYNAGEGAVDKYSGVPPYQETMLFVERVGVLSGRYRTALAGSLASAGAGATTAAASSGAAN
jgi:soluble lytic murein transglycosylase-like protein